MISELELVVHAEAQGVGGGRGEALEVAVVVQAEAELARRGDEGGQGGQAGVLVQRVDGVEPLALQGQDGLGVQRQDAVDERDAASRSTRLLVHHPGDEGAGMLAPHAGQDRGRAQDVALGPALDDQDLGAEGLELRGSRRRRA